MEKLVYTIEELAVALGYKSVGAIYKHIYRKNYDAIPAPVKLGAKLVWPIDRVKTWLSAKSDAAMPMIDKSHPAAVPQQSTPKKRGRPRKNA